jgi:hypothetical protein
VITGTARGALASWLGSLGIPPPFLSGVAHPAKAASSQKRTSAFRGALLIHLPPQGLVEESEKAKFLRALPWFSAQPVAHALLVGVGIQVTTFVFLPTAAPADIVAAQAFLLFGLFLIIKESIEDFHLHLHPILLESPYPDRYSAIRPAPRGVEGNPEPRGIQGIALNHVGFRA